MLLLLLLLAAASPAACAVADLSVHLVPLMLLSQRRLLSSLT
jgi:hypothetical protein